MKKGLITLLLAFAALFSSYGQIAQIEGDPVDYDLIIIPRGSQSVPLVFHMENANFTAVDLLNYTLGEENGAKHVDTTTVGFKHIDFKGELRHTWDISPETIERAIQRALRQTGLTRHDLSVLSDQIDRYAKINYTLKDFKNDMIDFVSASASLAGGGMAVDVFSTGAKALVNGNFTYDTTGATLEVGSMAHDYMEGVLTGWGETRTSAGMFLSGEALKGAQNLTGAKGTLDNLETIGRITLEQAARDVQKWDNRVATYALFRYLSFYNWANYYLYQYAKEDGGDAWVILINQRSQPIPVEFSGTHNSVTWTLSAAIVKCGDLGRLPNRPRYAHEGHYVGMIWATADYDFSGFQREFAGTGVKQVIENETADLWKINLQQELVPGLKSREVANQLMNIATNPLAGGRVDRVDASISLNMKFNSPVYIEFEEEGNNIDGVVEFSPIHLAEMDKADFDKVAIARSLGIADADPHSTTTIDMSMDCIAEGIESHHPPKPAVPLMCHETVEGDKYTYLYREGQTLERNTSSTFDFVSGYFPTILPYGEFHINMNEQLEPTVAPSRPNDTADKARILKKYFK